MAGHLCTQTHRHRRPGVVAVQVGVMLIALFGFAALTVDLGSLYNARGDLQRTADAPGSGGLVGRLVLAR